ncbi:Zinc finger protein var3 protein [Thalictrum thalictroides]|uniref:Zinc finger protein var3 protein n=1 Tax=Thalictrum thalictroides TaxID=46969 RepID=A0A7J6UX25_THATH|nr:Zinc finger protein var3 protein [Thalictrum thalictroides]
MHPVAIGRQRKHHMTMPSIQCTNRGISTSSCLKHNISTVASRSCIGATLLRINQHVQSTRLPLKRPQAETPVSNPLQMREFTVMAASRRLLFGSSFFRINRNTPSITPSSSISKTLLRRFSNSSHSPLRFTKTTPLPSFSLSLKSHFFNKYTTSSAAIDILTDNSESETTTISSPSSFTSHPWPEWITFIEKLKSKGFLDETLLPVEDDDDEGAAAASIGTSKKDLNLLRNASLGFARERFDIFKLLSREHIKDVVEYGCPSLFRKAVNSAKRLRATLKLDEGDVCCACNLRGSCDRAYEIMKDSEPSARTVDIVRMLLIYALDPLVLSGGERPQGREHVEAAARKLLSELSELSETPPDPSLPKPAVKPPKQQGEKTMVREPSQSVEMKRGDWTCSTCNFMNFARNTRCLECKADGPKRVPMDDVEMKKGDWNCPQCNFMNFARNRNCKNCQESRPKRVPGEWDCPSCDFLNYRRNTVCLKCSCAKPKDEVAEYEDQIWRRRR